MDNLMLCIEKKVSNRFFRRVSALPKAYFKQYCKLVTLLLTIQIIAIQVLGANAAGYEPFSETNLAADVKSPSLTSPYFNKTISDFNISATPLLSSLLNTTVIRVSEIQSVDSIVPTLTQSDVEYILLQFDKIYTDLDEISEIFITDETLAEKQHNRVIRSSVARSPFTPRGQCSISIDKLTELKNAIDNHLSGSNVPQIGKGHCEYFSTSNNCNEIVKLIQCGVHRLKDMFVEANSKSISYQELVKLKNEYDSLNEMYNKMKDDVRRSVSQEYQEKIDKLEKDNQNLSKALNKTVDELKKATINFCTSEIHSGRIDSAVSSFKDLKDNSLLSIIVEKSYNYLSDAERNNSDKKLDNFDNIVNFTRNFPFISQGAVGYTALLEVMKANNHFSIPKILFLSELIQQYMSMDNYVYSSQEHENNISVLKSSLKTYVDDIILQWSSKIRNDNYEQIISFAKDKNPCRRIESFYFHLPDIIKSAYSNNLNNVESILIFIRDLPYIEQSIVALSALFENMKTNNDLDSYQLLMVASAIKHYINKPNCFNEIDKNKKYLLENIKSKLPKGVRTLIWDSYVTIESRAYCGYTLYGSKYGNIYTYPSDNYKGYLNQEWDVFVSDYGRYFQFKNRENKIFLYSKEEKVFSGNLDDDLSISDNFFWEINPIANGKYFYIKNKGSFKVIFSNKVENCYSSRLCCCSTVRGVDVTENLYQHWMIY